MPISLAEVKERTATCRVYELVQRTGMKAGDLVVKYRIIDADTVDEEAELLKITQDDSREAINQYIRLVCRDIVEWDLLVEEGGKPVPLTPEAVREMVPSDILQDILQAIRKHKRPGEVSGRSQPRR